MQIVVVASVVQVVEQFGGLHERLHLSSHVPQFGTLLKVVHSGLGRCNADDERGACGIGHAHRVAQLYCLAEVGHALVVASLLLIHVGYVDEDEQSVVGITAQLIGHLECLHVVVLCRVHASSHLCLIHAHLNFTFQFQQAYLTVFSSVVAVNIVAQALVTVHERIGLHGVEVVFGVQHLKSVVFVAVLGLGLAFFYDVSCVFHISLFQCLFALIVSLGEMQGGQFRCRGEREQCGAALADGCQQECCRQYENDG